MNDKKPGVFKFHFVCRRPGTECVTFVFTDESFQTYKTFEWNVTVEDEPGLDPTKVVCHARYVPSPSVGGSDGAPFSDSYMIQPGRSGGIEWIEIHHTTSEGFWSYGVRSDLCFGQLQIANFSSCFR